MRISLEEAGHKLKEGEVIAVPTETVYGLAASIHHLHAIKKIYELKKRPQKNPLIVHLADYKQLPFYAEKIPKGLDLLAQHFWPGPLTVILPAIQEKIPSLVRAELPTAAFRIPSHSLAKALLEWVGPLVMPSANLSGKPSATCREHIETDFGGHFPVLDGGKCDRGLESTILNFAEDRWQIVRLGALEPELFYKVLGYYPEISAEAHDAQPISPGQMYRHYAPKALLHLHPDPYEFEGVVIGFQERIYRSAAKIYIMGSLSNPGQVAENLYALLRQLDDEQVKEACVDMSFPDCGLWTTIAERLTRAAERG